jgi:uncharacterized protein YndB with AHSA1/START domain
MLKIQKSITIDAPVQQVFDYVADPRHHPEYWPSLTEVKDVKPLPKGGYTYKFVYKMAGVRLEGTAEDIEFITKERVVTKITGGLDAKFTYTFHGKDGGTRLTVDTEYQVPTSLLGKVAEPFIVKFNEHEAEAVLANLKAKMEVGIPAKASR